MIDDRSLPAPARFPGAAWLVGAWHAQRWMWSEAWCKWRRRALPSTDYARRLGDGQRFALQRGSWMGVLVPMVVFSQFVDVLLCQGALHIVVADVVERWLLHALVLFVSLWTVVWAVSLRSAMRHIDHVLGPRALTLAIGFKRLAHIPLASIAGVQVIDHRSRRSGDDWFDNHRLKPRDVTVLTALDKPTLLITLGDRPVGAWGSCNGVRKPLRRHVAVYVDQPAVMLGAVTAVLPTTAAAPA